MNNNWGGGGGNGEGNQRSGYATFLATDPPIIFGAREPLDAYFWLHAIEDKLGPIQCNDDEKVTFAGHQLRDVAKVWWRGYKQQAAQGLVYCSFVFIKVLQSYLQKKYFFPNKYSKLL